MTYEQDKKRRFPGKLVTTKPDDFLENFDDESKAVHIAWQVYMRGRFLVRHTCISRISLD